MHETFVIGLHLCLTYYMTTDDNPQPRSELSKSTDNVLFFLIPSTQDSPYCIICTIVSTQSMNKKTSESQSVILKVEYNKYLFNE